MILPHDDEALKDIVDAETKQLIRNVSAAGLLNDWLMEPMTLVLRRGIIDLHG